jgi:hypothetical protein
MSNNHIFGDYMTPPLLITLGERAVNYTICTLFTYSIYYCEMHGKLLRRDFLQGEGVRGKFYLRIRVPMVIFRGKLTHGKQNNLKNCQKLNKSKVLKFVSSKSKDQH